MPEDEDVEIFLMVGAWNYLIDTTEIFLMVSVANMSAL